MADGQLEAAAVNEALRKDHAARMSKGRTIHLPNSTIVSERAYMGARYPGGESVTGMLGAPERFMKESKTGYRYIWKVRADKKTAHMIKSGIARAVEMDEMRSDISDAEFSEVVTPSGRYVVWENMCLLELVPKAVERYYTSYERYAVSRLIDSGDQFASDVEEATSGAYKGEFTQRDKAVGR